MKLALLMLAMLSGCSYWTEGDYSPDVIVISEQTCNGPYGCTVIVGTLCEVHIKPELSKAQRRCTLKHELRHCMGDDHQEYTDRPHFGIDCGDGSVL